MGLGLDFWALTGLVFSFTYVNGFHDGGNVVATLIASRAMSPRAALVCASVVELASPFAVLLIGASVSSTVKSLVDEAAYTDPAAKHVAVTFIAAGIVAALAWNLATWYFGLPASSSHALVGGVVGSGLAAFGAGNIAWGFFLGKVVVMVFAAPLAGFLVGFAILRGLFALTRNASVRVNAFFRRAQWANMAFLAFNHSFNDSQKTIGIVMILLGIHAGHAEAAPPLWAIACSATALASGIMFGGFRIIRTVGTGIYRVRPIHSFASQLASGAVILTSSLAGAPVSSSQIVSSSVMGVGSAANYKSVRWSVAGRILVSWLITIPLAGALGALLFAVFNLFA